jgi:hypothetical protein
MAVFAYSPTVEVYIKSMTRQEVIDVSPDMVRGQTILRSNAPHQMSITLMNKNRRYDAFFSPNDLFAIYMKRTRRLLVMSGYLDSVPWYSAWERSVQLFGTCTTKRLLQKRWDPGTAAALQLMSSEGNSAQQLAVDGGMMAKALGLITQVGGWPEDTIHIAALPMSWAQKISYLYNAANPMLLGSIWGTAGGKVSLKTSNDPMVGSTQDAQNVPKKVSTANQMYFSLPESPGQGVAAVPYTGAKDIKPDTSAYFCQMDWGYLAPGAPSSIRPVMRQWLAAKDKVGSGPVMVYFPETNKTVLCEPAGQGPGAFNPSNIKIGLSQAAMTYLGINAAAQKAGAIVYLAWCDQKVGNHYPPGPWPSITTTKKVKGKTVSSIDSRLPVTGNQVTGNQNPYVTTETSSAQGAQVVAFCRKVVDAGLPYVWSTSGPNSYDCSGFVYGAWKAAGLQPPQWTRKSTYGYWDDGATGLMKLFHDKTQLQPGDIVWWWNHNDPQQPSPPNHMGIYTGRNSAGQQVTAQAEGTTIGIHDNLPLEPGGDLTVYGFGRPTGYPGYSGKPSTTLPGSTATGTPSTGFAQGSGVDTGTQTNQSFLQYWEWFGQAPTALGTTLSGIRGLLNDQPLLPFINTVLNSSMRSWCSAPNGDFISWFPDYFGAYGQAAAINVADVELMDFSMSWSDQNMVTHQYIASSWVSNVFGASPAGNPNLSNITGTDGIVTLDMGSLSNNILQTVLNLKNGDASGLGDPSAILNRFGARPNFQQIGVIMGPMAQFWYALFLFQLNWASMFTATVPTTFMPEAYPGMLLKLTDGFQAYINQVVHAWDYSDGGPGFTTQMAIMAPSDWKHGGLYGLPNGGRTAIV